MKVLRSFLPTLLAMALSTLSFLPASFLPAHAAEGGAGAYLLGLRNAGAGVTPPPGIYLSEQIFLYNGTILGRLPTEGGPLPASAQVDVAVNVPTFIWVTPAEILGGRLGLSTTVPYGRISIKGNVGPLTLEDATTTFADPIVSAFLGWKSGSAHWQLGASGYLPWGDYEKGALANIAKHRLALDLYGSLTLLDVANGIDVTNVIGLTLNAENDATNYKSGNELHWDWGITKKWSSGLSIGAIGYVYHQITDDTGTGASLGGFRGRATAVGGSLGYDFQLGKLPVSTRVRYYHELEVKNRLKGDAAFLSLSMPLWVERVETP